MIKVMHRYGGRKFVEKEEGDLRRCHLNSPG